jgi:hypothetical protein
MLSAISSTFISISIFFLEEHLFGYDVIEAYGYELIWRRAAMAWMQWCCCEAIEEMSL